MKKNLLIKLWIFVFFIFLIACFCISQWTVRSEHAAGGNRAPVILSPIKKEFSPRSSNFNSNEKEAAIFNSPINFWGRVIDSEGNGIPDVSIQFCVIDKPMSDKGKSYNSMSDEGGFFSLFEAKGAGLYVSLAKDGYTDNNQSAQKLFGYGIENLNPPPTAQNPAIFVLEKVDKLESVVTLSSGSIQIGEAGKSIQWNLEKGLISKKSDADIQIDVWVHKNDLNELKRYPWGYCITVSNGKIIEKTEAMKSRAPIEGYVNEGKFEMPLSDTWNARVDKEYFVKFSDGRFAWLKLGARTKNVPYIVIDSKVNLSGSRDMP